MGRKNDIPFGEYWRGKSLYRSPFRGTFIGPVHIISRDGEPGFISRRSSRARSPTEKSSRSRPRCEIHDSIRPSTPSGSDSSDSNAARKCSGKCCSVGRDYEPQQLKKCQSSPSPKLAGSPNGPLHTGCFASTSSLTPPSHCHFDCCSPSLQSPSPSYRDSFQDCHRLPSAHAVCAVHQPMEAPRNSASPAKRSNKPTVSSSDIAPHHHCCYRAEEYLSEPSSYATISIADDSSSENSVDISPISDKCADECRCNHFIFAIPCGFFEVGYVAE